MDFITIKGKKVDASAINSAATNPIKNNESDKLQEKMKAASEDASVFADITFEGLKAKTEGNKENDFWATLSKTKLEELYSHLDTDKDGKLSTDEIKEYSLVDGDELNLSLLDLKDVFEKMGLELSSAPTVDSILDKFSEDTKANAEDVKNIAQSSTPNLANTAQSAGGGLQAAGGGSGAQGAGGAQSAGGGGGGASPMQSMGSNNGAAPIADSNSVEGLEKQKKEAQDGVKAKQEDVKTADKTAADEIKKEKEKMDEAIKKDEKISQELKEKKSKVEENINTKQSEITEQKTLLSEKTTQISALKDEESGLKEALSSLPEPTPDKTDENGNVVKGNADEINKRKEELNKQIEAKGEEIKKAEEEKTEIEKQITTKEEELKTLQEEKKTIDAEIEKVASPETKTAMKEYEEAKTRIEKEKTDKVEKLNGEIKSGNEKIKEIDVKINEMKNKKLEKGDNAALIDKLNSQFGKGVLNGKGDEIIAAAEKYGIEPELFAAIIALETGFGTSKAIKNANNPGGMMDPSTGWSKLTKYGTLTDGLNAMAKNLKTGYYDKGLTTPQTIGPKYCPIGAANDPNGTNKHWIPSVTKFYNEFKGA